MYSKTILIGRLGKDPELRATQNKIPVANFSIATSEVSVQNGVKIEKTEWHNIVAWQKNAENAAKFLKKGSLVFVEGKLAYKKYTDKNGIERYQTEIIVYTLKFLTPAKVQSPQEDSSSYDFGEFAPFEEEPKQQEQRNSAAWDDDDGIPF